MVFEEMTALLGEANDSEVPQGGDLFILFFLSRRATSNNKES